MKKIIVFSDSHKETSLMRQVTSNLLSSKMFDFCAIIHLGDHRSDAICLQESGLPVYAVPGNCDTDLANSGQPQQSLSILKTSDPAVGEIINRPHALIEIAGVKILITHGHRYNVKSSYMSLCYKAREMGADACLFGHTHIPCEFDYENIKFLNPGSVKYGKTYGILTIDNCQIYTSVVKAK